MCVCVCVCVCVYCAAVTLARNSLGETGFCGENYPLSFVFGLRVFADVTPNQN